MANPHLLGVGTVVAFFDAFGIGANDVSNSFATSVNSGVFTMSQVAVIAVLFEFLGAITAGGKVSKTIQKGIISASLFKGKEGLLQLGMVIALLASATYLQIATRLALPVSTTHSIVGAVLGIGVAAFGGEAILWGFGKSGKLNGIDTIPSDGFGPIALSWVVSPIVAGVFAAAMFWLTKALVMEDNFISRRVHSKPFWRAVYLAPLFYGFVGGILVVLLAFKGVSKDSNANQLNEIAKNEGKLALTACMVALGSTIFAAIWVSWWQVRITWRGEDLKGWQWAIHPFLPKQPTRAGFKSAHLDASTAIVPAAPSSDASTSSVDVEAAASQEKEGQAKEATTAKEAATAAAAVVTADAHKIKVVPPAIQAALAIAEEEGYVVREMEESEKVFRQYKLICTRGTLLERLLCPLRIFTHGIFSHDGKEREVKDYHHDDPAVAAMHDMARQYDPMAEEFFKQLQIVTAIIACFSHGSNDVANALGPYSTIVGVYQGTGTATAGYPTPDWMLAFGGISIGIGFLVYGYHLMRSLGNCLTFHSPSRGYCMELGASITVLLASRIGLPISTTQCITGATVAVGIMSGLRAVNWRRMAVIFSSWVLTVPIVGTMSGLLFAFIAASPNFRSPVA